MADCWNLLEGRREHYLPRGEREPEAAYRRRVEAALPSGFFRDALRTFAGMLSRENWTALPSGLELVLSDVDGRGTDLGAFLAAADVLVLRDGGCLLLVLPPDHLWPSEGDRQQALRRGDRLSLPRLQLIPRTDLLNWQLPHSHDLPAWITWREQEPAPWGRRPALHPPVRSAVGHESIPVQQASTGQTTRSRLQRDQAQPPSHGLLVGQPQADL